MKRCPTPRFLAVIAAALCLSLIAVSGLAQFQTGNIYGKIQAKDGSVLPGVSVVLTGVGAPQTAVSDAQGNFRFLNLSPGAYTLKAELAGYGTATRAGVSVNVGRNADVTLTLNPSVSESITVTAEAPLLDVRKAGTGVNVSKVEMEKVPTSRDPWTILQQAPSVQVDRINVGGSQSGQQSVYVGKGSAAAQNTWNMDGVNITDMGATGSSPLYFDFDSFEEMQVTTGGSDPRIQTPGVQLNMVTKRGTNDYRGSARYFYTPGSYQADATVPAEATTYLDRTNRINYVRDYGAEIGGPIWRDHIWFWLADADQKISNQSAQAPGATGAFDNIILRNKNAKLNGQITASNSAVGFYTWGDKVRNARNLSSTRPFETAWRQTGPTKVYKIEDTQIVGSSLYVTGMWSKVAGGFSLAPNGGTDASAPAAWRDLSAVWHDNFLFYGTERPQKQYRIDGSKFFDMGNMNHELKFGFGYRNTPVSSLTTWPGANHGFLRQRAASFCAARGEPGLSNCAQMVFVRDRVAAYDEKYNDFYLGDTILMGNLTLQAGLRYDQQKSRNTATTATPNRVLGTPITVPCSTQLANAGVCTNITTSLPALNFSGDDRDLKWTSLSPRIGLTYALGADKKTLLRAAYNRYVNQLGSAVSGASPLGYASYLYFIGNDANNDHVAQRSEILRLFTFYYVDPFNPTSLDSTIRLDYDMNPPHSDELSIGFEREVMTDFSIGVNATYRKYNDLLYNRAEKTQGGGDFYTRNDYVLVGSTPAGLGHNLPAVPIYDVKPGVAPPSFFVLTNRPDYSQEYKGLELVATKRLSNRWMLRGNFSWNDWTEDCGEEATSDPTPFLGNCPGGQFTERSAGSGAFGNVFINSKWTANLTGVYQLPWDFSVGASFVARQGYPRPFRYQASDACFGDPTTSCTADGVADDKTVVLEPIGKTRFDNVYELDLRVAKDFRFFNRVGVTIAADLFNAPNKRTIMQRQTDLSDSVGTGDRITELQSPRVWRFGARLNF